jgi:peptidoglycan lytic transglycosylase
MGAITSARILPAVLALAFLLGGCASSEPQLSDNHHHRFRRGQPNYTVAPYQVNGVWYYPKADYNYDETGTASWYGPGFDGRMTSDGEIYDMNQLSAAHKTLPLPSVVQVTNMQNGRSLQLRVNDRGPFVDGRLIDLSRRAAQLLGFEGVGTAPVRVKIMKQESIQVAEAALRGETGQVLLAQVSQSARPEAPRREPAPVTQLAAATTPSLRAAEVIAGPLPAAAPPTIEVRPEPMPSVVPSPPPAVAATSRRSWPGLIATAHAATLPPAIAAIPPPPKPAAPAARRSGRIFVQAGAFAMPENAQRVRARLAALGGVEVVRMAANGNGTALYRVRLGPVASEAEAARLLSKVVGSGYPGARVVGE